MTSERDQANIDPEILSFKGPAGEKFDSFQEQASYFLDTYWPHWQNYDNPKSYIIPPTFKYKHPEVSDQNFKAFYDQQKEKVARNPHEIITDRRADDGEFLVYNAIQQLIENKIKAPFIAIRSLDLRLNFDSEKKKVCGLLTQIFPNVNWDKFHALLGKPNQEYDFLLIGPQIGIVVIEVKSSRYTKKDDFGNRSRVLPNEYQAALKQLESINGLTYLLQEYTGMSMQNEKSVKKVLFTSNLEKARYDNWLSTRTEADREGVYKKIGDIILWFEVDGKQMSSKLEQMFNNCAPISIKLYEEYAKILATMASIISMDGIEFSKVNFSEYEIAVKEHEYLIEQNLLMERKNKQIAAPSRLIKSSKEVKKFSNVIFLTPDQQKALNGPSYQFIFGAAGTGKSVVLQAKACQLLAKGESVAVFATFGYMRRYKKIFDKHGFTNYTIFDLNTKGKNVELQNIRGHFNRQEETYSDITQIIDSYIAREIQNGKSQLTKSFDYLTRFDNIIFDDAFDWTTFNDTYFPYIIMRFAQTILKKNNCWVGIDPYFRDKNHLMPTTDGKLDNNCNDVWVAILTKVMRCSEEIYQNVYIPTIFREFQQSFGYPLETVPGHKIKGCRVTKIKGHFATFTDALYGLFAKIELEIEKLSNDGIGLEKIAIIICDDHWYNEEGGDCRFFLRDRFKQKWPNRVSESDYLYNLKKDELYSLENELTHEIDFCGANNLLLITSYEFVSSLEWPVVISIDLKSTVDSKDLLQRPILSCLVKYRGMTRATAKLIDITFTCDECPSSWTWHEWDSSELDLLINIFKEYCNMVKHTINKTSDEMSTEEQQTWMKICKEFNDSRSGGIVRTLTTIKYKVDNIFNECYCNYSHDLKTLSKPEKPKYFDIFNDIYDFAPKTNKGLFHRLINCCASICGKKSN